MNTVKHHCIIHSTTRWNWLRIFWLAWIVVMMLQSETSWAQYCRFDSSTTLTLPMAASIDIPPGVVGETGIRTQTSRSVISQYATCDQGVAISGGSYVPIPLHLYFDTYYTWYSSDTVRIGTSDFGWRILGQGVSILAGPLRVQVGQLLFNVGGAASDTRPSVYIIPSLPFASGKLEIELVRLSDTRLPQSLNIAPSSRIFGTIKADTLRVINNNNWTTFVFQTASIDITSEACTVNSVNVPLGTVNMTGGVGTASPAVPFVISLTDCPTNTPIYYRIDPTTSIVTPAPGDAGESLMALDSSISSAQGVAIQLLYNDGTTPHPLGATVTLTPTALSAPQFDLWLAARYMQITPGISPGVANSSATITLSYQ